MKRLDPSRMIITHISHLKTRITKHLIDLILIIAKHQFCTNFGSHPFMTLSPHIYRANISLALRRIRKLMQCFLHRNLDPNHPT